MNRLLDRRLEPGRGRVYQEPHDCGCGWSADFRDQDGTLYGIWAPDLDEAFDWIRSMCREVR